MAKLRKSSGWGAGTNERIFPVFEHRDDPVLLNLLKSHKQQTGKEEDESAVSDMPPALFVPLLVREMMKKGKRRESVAASTRRNESFNDDHDEQRRHLNSNSLNSLSKHSPESFNLHSGSDSDHQPSTDGQRSQFTSMNDGQFSSMASQVTGYMGVLSMTNNLQPPPSVDTPRSGALTPPTPLTPSVAETPRSLPR